MTRTAESIQPLAGYHHMTMVCRDARENVRFYRDTLGLRLVKKTVNFDVPDTYHLYWGDDVGSPGTLLTFFEWPHAARGNTGWGGTHHVGLAVASGAVLAYWRGRLERSGVELEELFDDHGHPTIRFRDPDGLLLELSAPAGEDVPDGTPDLYVPAMAIGRLQHVHIQVTDSERALIYYRNLLGFDLVGQGPHHDDPGLTDLIFDVLGDGAQRLIVTEVDRDQTPRAREGTGQTHHVAFGATDDPHELAWQERITHAGVPTTEVRDRKYFHSIYFNDPDGHLIEIATANPGFAVDEPAESLGQALSLPQWLESRRAELEQSLTPLG